MARSADSARFDRRTLLLGAGGLLVTSGCSGGGGDTPSTKASASPSASSSGPIVHEQDAGTVITQADIDDLVGRLNAAVRGADVDSLKAIAPSIRRPVWQQRLDNLAHYPMDDIGFAFDESLGRQINASGGRLEVDAYMALTHQITGVDSRPALQIYSATLVKDDPDAAVQISEIDNAPSDDTSPAPWDLPGDWEVVEGDHVLVVALGQDIARVRAALPTIDDGVAQAMEVIAPPAGVTKAYFAFTDPDSRLYGQVHNSRNIRERDGLAMRVGYIDPTQAAKSGEGAGSKAAYAGARLILHPAALGSADRLHGVALHETIHGLAFQWGDADPWPTEGLAMWAELGGLAGLRSDSFYWPLVRSGFGGFRARMQGANGVDSDVFQDPATTSTNYGCACAVYGYVESRGGRAAVLRFARTAYSKTAQDAAMQLGFEDADDLFWKVQQWVTTI